MIRINLTWQRWRRWPRLADAPSQSAAQPETANAPQRQRPTTQALRQRQPWSRERLGWVITIVIILVIAGVAQTIKITKGRNDSVVAAPTLRIQMVVQPTPYVRVVKR